MLARLAFLSARRRLDRWGPASAAVAFVLAFPSTALAKHPSEASPRAGYDISYPQCGQTYPSGQAFGVVGVNGGLANDANPCLRSELTWAAASPGLAGPVEPAASLYINTADPGNGVADWPSPANGTASGSTPYGSCEGGWSSACAYLYGKQRASYSYNLVQQAGSSVQPGTAPWWLDIETVNSWATSGNSANWASLNIATIQGFIAGLHGSGATGPVGFYSTGLQWRAITGLTPSDSSRSFPTSEPDWVAGARSLSSAKANCSASFTGGAVELAQFSSGGFDADYACP